MAKKEYSVYMIRKDSGPDFEKNLPPPCGEVHMAPG